MHIHILGICGTFMGSLAVLAKELGHTVSGSDANVYPPMSTQLEEQGIRLCEGFDPAHLQPHPDLVVVGNAMSRGNPAVEYVLNQGLPYCSGPEWLSRFVLQGKWVLAVAGTHGKTTTSAMVAWILEYAGMQPGYLIGGVLKNFPVSARLGGSDFFVVEADEYDSAFFDKRSKFVHYRPRTLILNNLEYDHADIFPDLAAIQRQFHHLIRIVPGEGLIIRPRFDEALAQVLEQGCWTPTQSFAVLDAERDEGGRPEPSGWGVRLLQADGSVCEISKTSHLGSTVSARLQWSLSGRHNVCNAVAAIAAAHHVGVDITVACEALGKFASVKRRMELLGEVRGIHVYDDFAHHPTAIETTLDGIRQRLNEIPGSRLIAVIEPRSATMKMGVHQSCLASSCRAADLCLWMSGAGNGLDIEGIIAESPVPALNFNSVDDIVAYLSRHCRAGDHIVIMSNGGFGGIHGKLLSALAA
ncbi:UDP-N-acetylmuramate:L-alanyl-gamma-D-glutamyl-meso-diaminopimelate ligase [Pseudohongiella sp.]|uniref:UDP-N-acetylmuramate:L-alanyl-gamma-D-glutamyl-meso-diaminopimelate ligase n=1 Tax=marine sediment metagenome TaxID=412755 RepID=A0A0F9WIC9_9ZZZZ|nr:UDP-N-acetylmuramate:L-alanyl-gamma-D-glutamyl-meso-diaminopimelate ligase [Pseudohongiella sp.]HDZ09409.1 UDP-N-acetylmuramate:L-alanyl-gamma-D-glutamyl-meso-diaminopimelate ligase [Pseudohongiella sp.]HEA63336.1 UDP-N-acetylmuramate:L-alanyl-gamma-D-glutamyl-meso-diaminopimelate ligase [Pseudohongiella sp.]